MLPLFIRGIDRSWHEFLVSSITDEQPEKREAFGDRRNAYAGAPSLDTSVSDNLAPGSTASAGDGTYGFRRSSI